MDESKFYKRKFLIVFYDKTDEIFRYMFDNVREILKFQNRECTQQNIKQVQVELYRALKSKEHFTRFLTGEDMRVYIIDIKEGD